ncbi:hypothetical protein Tco_1369577 [Tanacetum coccineum]
MFGDTVSSSSSRSNKQEHLAEAGLDSCVLGYGTRYFESKGGGGRGVKEKQHGSTNANVVSSAIDEPSTTAPINSGNKNGTEEGNIGGIPSPANDENLNDVGTTVRPTPVVVLMESIRAISERFANTAYGFFLGKRMSYPVVTNYVRNTWGKYGLVKSMLNSSTGNVPVWVKLHSVSITAFNEDGLSAIATKLGKSSYAKAMIELQADVELKDTIVMAMPKLTGEGFYTCTILLNMSGNHLGVRVVRTLVIFRRNVPRIQVWVWRRT